MRKTTRKKYYGRSAVVGALRGAATELTETIALVEQEMSTLEESLRRVEKRLEAARKAEECYKLGRKRITAKLNRQKEAVKELVAEVNALPVFPEERLVDKQERQKKKDSKAKPSQQAHQDW